MLLCSEITRVDFLQQEGAIKALKVPWNSANGRLDKPQIALALAAGFGVFLALSHAELLLSHAAPYHLPTPTFSPQSQAAFGLP